jgi:ArsR family transcriptional regulator
MKNHTITNQQTLIPTPARREITDELQHRAASAPSGVGLAPKFVPTLTEDEAVRQARLLKALADPTRLRLLNLLSRYEGDVCVFELVESFTLEQPTISHHLRILRDAGLVDCRKKGLWAYYYVRREALTRAQDIIENLK